MDVETTYQVGLLEHLREDDPVFTDYAEAVTKAKEGSWNDAAWAIWELPEGDVRAIIYQQKVYE